MDRFVVRGMARVVIRVVTVARTVLGAPDSVRPVPANEICESCGRDDEPLTKVQRIYHTPASGDTPASERAGDIEWWCFVCRTHYPHEVIADD